MGTEREIEKDTFKTLWIGLLISLIVILAVIGAIKIVEKSDNQSQACVIEQPQTETAETEFLMAPPEVEIMSDWCAPIKHYGNYRYIKIDGKIAIQYADRRSSHGGIAFLPQQIEEQPEL